MYLWQGRREPPTTAAEPQLPAPALAPALPPAPAPSAPVAQEAPSPAVNPAGTEFEAVFKKIAARHSGFEKESPDPAWAPKMEAAWRSFYESKPEVTVASIECKTSLCEVLLIGHGMDETTLRKVALKPGAQPLDIEKAGKKLVFLGLVTDGQGSSPVAVVTTMEIIGQSSEYRIVEAASKQNTFV